MTSGKSDERGGLRVVAPNGTPPSRRVRWFLWMFSGQLRNVEAAKHRMLELQRQIDERELQRSGGRS
jgi:hypothetical protein